MPKWVMDDYKILATQLQDRVVIINKGKTWYSKFGRIKSSALQMLSLRYLLNIKWRGCVGMLNICVYRSEESPGW